MKRTILLAAVAFLALSANSSAQAYYDYQNPNSRAVKSVDLHLGTGLSYKANLIAGADFAVLHKFSPSFSLGAGAGVDYIQALKYRTVSTKENQYWNEVSVPVFARGRYLFGRRGMIGNYEYGRNSMYGQYREVREGVHFFVQCDLGYRFCVTAINFDKDQSDTFEKGNAKGFFLEPQAGISLGRSIDIAVGLPFQGFNKHLIKEAGSAAEASKSLYAGGMVHLTFSW